MQQAAARAALIAAACLLVGSSALLAAPRATASSGAKASPVPPNACAAPPPPPPLSAGAQRLSAAREAANFHSLAGDQQVLAVNTSSLQALITANSEDLLITFYDPRCGHCQTFVMRDGQGNASNAPLEVLSRELIAAGGPKAVKLNMREHAAPVGLEVYAVPTLFLALRDGRTLRYEGQRDVPSLKAWALSPPAPELTTVFASAGKKVDVPAWACAFAPSASASQSKPQPSAVVLHAHGASDTGTVGEQQVLLVNDTSLTALLENASENILVVFYAPWCPHCQTFVMHDADGNATNAPLELFSRELEESSGPQVVKFDTQASSPTQFFVEYIPTIFLALRNGTKIQYKEDPHDLAALETFAMQSGSAAAASFLAAEKADAPAWACALPPLAASKPLPSDVVLHARGSEDTGAVGEQQVLAVNDTSLTALLGQASEDVLVAFYAPWCPHCQTFVMHDGHSNATNAPLEVLNRELVEANGPKVVKFDTQASRPTQFSVEYIPTIYLALRDGRKIRYEANPGDLLALKTFAMQGVAAPSSFAVAPATGKAPAATRGGGGAGGARRARPLAPRRGALAA